MTCTMEADLFATTSRTQKATFVGPEIAKRPRSITVSDKGALSHLIEFFFFRLWKEIERAEEELRQVAMMETCLY